jgi:OPA family glycerol-3-phosphate transporter-like MFS transporter
MPRSIARLVALSVLLVFGLVLGMAFAHDALADTTPVAASTAVDKVAAACAKPSKTPQVPRGDCELVRKVHVPSKGDQPLWEKLLPIAILLVVIAVVVMRLPRVELGHSQAFRRRRLLNWLILGLTYSFLYMARYNLNQYKYVGGLTESEFGTIFGWGSATYGVAFLLNGPLTDRWGGRTTILIASGGAAVTNLVMGYMIATCTTFGNPFRTMLVLYCANMYFQSFGAVSIVKVNGSWFHLRERGTFGGIFGILISLGLFFAYDGGKWITDGLPDNLEWLFFIPAGILLVFFALCFLFVRDTPSKAGLVDFDLGDATRPDDGAKESAFAVIWRLLSNPIILTIAAIELCSGFLRQAILQWGRDFSSGIGLGDSFVIQNWGVVSCIAGITGGIFAGAISDHLFQSRRGPVSAVLYSLMLLGALLIVPLMASPAMIPWIVAFMGMAIIGVHGMLSGTASADFGGRKNTGVAVGIIDGAVYAGSMLQSFIYGAYLPEKLVVCADGTTRPNPAVKDISNWTIWPYAMLPVALIGFVLALRLWNARAKPGPSSRR